MEIRRSRARVALGVVLVGMLLAAVTGLAATRSAPDEAVALDAGVGTKSGHTSPCGTSEVIGRVNNHQLVMTVCAHPRFVNEDGEVEPNPVDFEVIVENAVATEAMDVHVEITVTGMTSTFTGVDHDSFFFTLPAHGHDSEIFPFQFTPSATAQVNPVHVTADYTLAGGGTGHLEVNGQLEIPGEPAATLPKAPTNLRTVEPTSESHVYLEWDAPVTPPAFTHYEVRARFTRKNTNVDTGSPRSFPKAGEPLLTTTKFDLGVDDRNGFERITVRACNASGCGPWSPEVSVEVDPRGVVVDQHGAPVPGATVTLLRAERGEGLIAIPDGSFDLGPINRSNPSLTDDLGRFRWDAPPGRYVVRATKHGCVAGDGSGAPYAQTHVFETPPPVVDLLLVLECDTEGRS